jgi:hypothetical protein
MAVSTLDVGNGDPLFTRLGSPSGCSLGLVKLTTKTKYVYQTMPVQHTTWVSCYANILGLATDMTDLTPTLSSMLVQM